MQKRRMPSMSERCSARASMLPPSRSLCTLAHLLFVWLNRPWVANYLHMCMRCRDMPAEQAAEVIAEAARDLTDSASSPSDALVDDAEVLPPPLAMLEI